MAQPRAGNAGTAGAVSSAPAPRMPTFDWNTTDAYHVQQSNQKTAACLLAYCQALMPFLNRLEIMFRNMNSESTLSSLQSLTRQQSSLISNLVKKSASNENMLSQISKDLKRVPISGPPTAAPSGRTYANAMMLGYPGSYTNYGSPTSDARTSSTTPISLQYPSQVCSVTVKVGVREVGRSAEEAGPTNPTAR